MKVAILADDAGLPRFMIEAVNSIQECQEIALFRCTNTTSRRRIFEHGFYYALNVVSIVNSWTKILPLEKLSKRISQSVRFESVYEGAWQTLPEPVIDALSGFDIILKMGMGLLRVPPPERLPVPILSYHHGDPEKFRGRPSGFWEMFAGEDVMGQIVQVIGNQLDAGQIVAFAETKIAPWSYKATLVESYRHSPLIINQAIRNALTGRHLQKPSSGRNYRLPSNSIVIRFVFRMAVQYLKRLWYGTFLEKKWKVSSAVADRPSLSGLISGEFPPSETWQTLKTDPGYAFYADPFFTHRNSMVVEAMRLRTGLGEIVEIGEDGRQQCVLKIPGHLSYPFPFDDGRSKMVVPEMAEFGPQRFYALEAGSLRELGTLDIEDGGRLVDPTLYRREGRLYLFANLLSSGSNALWLWTAESIDGLFRRHPAGPICISPMGARMAGSLVFENGRLYRLGQDNRSGYGNGLCAFEIAKLSPTDYEERLVGRLRFERVKGPHTLNLSGDRLLFDWYREEFSLLAGPRRLIAHLLTRRQAN